MAAQQPKYQSVVFEDPQRAAELATAWDIKGYDVQNLVSFSTGTGTGHGPKFLMLFKLKRAL